jgi:hypothetical protein
MKGRKEETEHEELQRMIAASWEGEEHKIKRLVASEFKS